MPEPRGGGEPAGAETFTVEAADGVTLAADLLRPPGPAPGAPGVVLLHGIASHRGWYRDTARALAERGCVVAAVDRRGSGGSGGTRGHLRSWRRAVEDLERFCEAFVARVGARPLHLYGLSLGAVFALALALERPQRVTSLVLSAPGLCPAMRLPLLARLRVLKRSFTHPERLYELPFGVDALTDRADWQAVLAADPLRQTHVTARFLVEMFQAQRRILARLEALGVPALVQLAGDDRLIDNAATVAALRRVRRAGVVVEMHRGAAHVLVAALPADALAERLVRWFTDGHARARGFVVADAPAAAGAPAPPPTLPARVPT